MKTGRPCRGEDGRAKLIIMFSKLFKLFRERLTLPQQIFAVVIVLFLIGWGVFGIKTWWQTRTIVADYNAEKKENAKLKAEQTKIVEDNQRDAAILRGEIDMLKTEKAQLVGVAKEQAKALDDARLMVKQADTAFERAQAVKSIGSDYAATCALLAQLGHPCP